MPILVIFYKYKILKNYTTIMIFSYFDSPTIILVVKIIKTLILVKFC